MTLTIKPAISALLLATLVVASGCGQSTRDTVSSDGSTTPVEAEPSPTTRLAPAVSQPADAPAADPLADTLVVPGERVGPVTETTSREQLAELFGEENLRDEDVYVGEGLSEPGTVVDLGPERSFSIIWTDASKTKISVVKDFGPAWKTQEGIGIGTNFEELRSQLGQFQLYGFGWDYGGTLSMEGSNLEEYYGMLILRVQPTSMEDSTEAASSVMGEKLFSSDDPDVQALNPVVDQMLVYLGSRVEE